LAGWTVSWRLLFCDFLRRFFYKNPLSIFFSPYFSLLFSSFASPGTDSSFYSGTILHAKRPSQQFSGDIGSRHYLFSSGSAKIEEIIPINPLFSSHYTFPFYNLLMADY